MIKIKIDIKIIIMIQKTQPVKIFPSYYRYMSSEMENHVSLLGHINSFHYIIIYIGEKRGRFWRGVSCES